MVLGYRTRRPPGSWRLKKVGVRAFACGMRVGQRYLTVNFVFVKATYREDGVNKLLSESKLFTD